MGFLRFSVGLTPMSYEQLKSTVGFQIGVPEHSQNGWNSSAPGAVRFSGSPFPFRFSLFFSYGFKPDLILKFPYTQENQLPMI